MKKFSIKWKASVKPRKQRKYRAKAPLHIKGKFVSAHLSPELRKKHGKRAMRIRTGDRVKLMKGSYKGKAGKVERISISRLRVYITGIHSIRKDGTKNLIAFEPSNLMILEATMDDKRRTKREKNAKATPKETSSAKNVADKA